MLSAHYGAVQSTGLGRLENTEVLPPISFLTFPFGETEERLYEQEPGEPHGFAWLSFELSDESGYLRLESAGLLGGGAFAPYKRFR